MTERKSTSKPGVGKPTQRRLDVTRLAARQLADYDARTPGRMFAHGLKLSESDAYQLQAEVAKLREQRGEILIGFKLGCTSPAVQRQLRIDHPVFGRLFANECHASGKQLHLSKYYNLAVEGQFALRLSAGIATPGQSAEDFRKAIETVFPVIELYHWVFRGRSLSAAELIANNGLHAGFVMPTVFPHFREVARADLTVCINDRIEDSWTGTELAQETVRSLRWLAERLAQEGIHLKAGQIILPGTHAKLTLIESPSHIVVDSSYFGTVEAEIVP